MGTKQVFQFSPKSFDRAAASRLVKDGRLAGAVVSFSDFSYSFDSQVIAALRETSSKYNQPVALILAIRGLPETEQDFLDLQFGVKANLDYVLLPVTQSAKEIETLRSEIKKITKREVPVIARVDNARASAQLKQILKVADGVMLNAETVVIPADLPKEPDAAVADDPAIKSPEENRYRGKIWITGRAVDKRLAGIIQTLLILAEHVDAQALAVGEERMARGVALHRKTKPAVVLATRDQRTLNRAALFWGVEPVAVKADLKSTLKAKGLVAGQRYVDATQKSAGIIESVA